MTIDGKYVGSILPELFLSGVGLTRDEASALLPEPEPVEKFLARDFRGGRPGPQTVVARVLSSASPLPDSVKRLFSQQLVERAIRLEDKAGRVLHPVIERAVLRARVGLFSDFMAVRAAAASCHATDQAAQFAAAWLAYYAARTVGDSGNAVGAAWFAVAYAKAMAGDALAADSVCSEESVRQIRELRALVLVLAD